MRGYRAGKSHGGSCGETRISLNNRFGSDAGISRGEIMRGSDAGISREEVTRGGHAGIITINTCLLELWAGLGWAGLSRAGLN